MTGGPDVRTPGGNRANAEHEVADAPIVAPGAYPSKRATVTADDQPDAIDCKRFATLRARLALAGWGLIRTDPSDGAPIYFATRWNMPRELADLAAVEAFADRVGAPR